MMLDRVGFEITTTVYTDKAKTDEHKASVLARNTEIVTQNKAIEGELVPLRKSLQAKTIELQKAADEAQKTQLQAEVDDLKGKIAALESTKKPQTACVGPVTFPTRDEADAYVEQVKQAALRLKTRATAK